MNLLKILSTIFAITLLAASSQDDLDILKAMMLNCLKIVGI